LSWPVGDCGVTIVVNPTFSSHEPLTRCFNLSK
jgi:hypothetical protein